MQLSDPSPLPRPISHILFRGCANDAQVELRSRIPIREGDVLSDELLERTREAAKAFQDRLEIVVNRALPREVYYTLPPEVRSQTPPPAVDDGVNVTIYDPASLPQRIRIGGRDQAARLVEKVMPPEPALETGVVQLAVIVGKHGAVVDVQALSGPESLTGPAADAVRRWRYVPTLLNGFPVEVQTVVELSFTRPV